MRWIGNTLANNAAYGFDPHDLSNDFVVQNNIAHGNGRHGFIFSRGCDRSVLRNNTSYDNRGHGFMIDDGRTADAPNAKASRLPSNDSVLIGNRAYDNDGSGIEIEGGTGTVVKNNVLERNHVGVRIKNDASVIVENNRIAGSALAGVDVLTGADRVLIRNNTITGGWASIALGDKNAAQLAINNLQDASTPLAIAGQAVREDDLATTIGRVFRWNPLLVLWATILGVPTVFGVHQLARYLARRRRLPPGNRRRISTG
jgi:parallel beta-helix repeat protein